MKTIYKNSILVLLIATSGCFNANILNPPNWFIKPNCAPKHSCGVGTSEESEIIAISNALVAFAHNVDTDVKGLYRTTTENEDIEDEKRAFEMYQESISLITIPGIEIFSLLRLDQDSQTNKFVSMNRISSLQNDFIIEWYYDEEDDRSTLSTNKIDGINAEQLTVKLQKLGGTVIVEKRGKVYYCSVRFPSEIINE